MVGHRGYVGAHFQTWAVLEEMFGADAVWEKPGLEPAHVEEPKLVVN